jgi:hypothetical protein
MTNIGIYRAAEGDKIDMHDSETLKWMTKNYPAVMSTRPIGMSEDYQFMPSFKIAQGLQEHFDLALTQVSQQWSRMRNPAGQEHVMRFRFPGDSQVQLKEVGDSIPELVIFNSHNGRSAIKAFAGVFRLVCSNGMVVADRSFGNLKMRHFGAKNTFAAFGETLSEMARRMTILDKRMKKMQSIILHPHDQNQLARLMIDIRKAPTWVEPHHVLLANRPEDERTEDGSRNLWVTFNVLQENLTKREIDFRPEGGRPRSIRPLSGARADLLVNEALWQALETFIEDRFPEIQGDVFDVIPEVQEKAKALPAPKPVVRSFDDLIKLNSVTEFDAITDIEKALLSKEERTKIAKRKSYLKSKELLAA